MIITRLIRLGLFNVGYNLAKQTRTADILALIQRLNPQECGIELIRVGSNHDGGYLIPNDLEGVDYCFSPGVSTVSDFENQLADFGIKSFLADYSVDSAPVIRPEIKFDKKFLGSSNREPYFTLETWKNKYLMNYQGDLILQMDIEGSEYEVILNAPDDLLDQFRIIVIEFHDLDNLFYPFGFRLLSTCFEKLLNFFYVVHIHPNNVRGIAKRGGLEVPGMMEFTFLNKRRVTSARPQKMFPHKLDADNVPGDSLRLPRCWYISD
jgi:hypothetical protein